MLWNSMHARLRSASIALLAAPADSFGTCYATRCAGATQRRQRHGLCGRRADQADAGPEGGVCCLVLWVFGRSFLARCSLCPWVIQGTGKPNRAAAVIFRHCATHPCPDLLYAMQVFDFCHTPHPELPDDHPSNRTIDGFNRWPQGQVRGCLPSTPLLQTARHCVVPHAPGQRMHSSLPC